MTDSAHLFLVPESAEAHVGARLAEVGELEYSQSSAVLGWLDAHGVRADSDRLRLLPPEARGSVPAGAEALPVPLSEEELDRLRTACAAPDVAELERELRAYRETTEDRERLVTRALAGGVPPHRIAELTGLDPADIAHAAS
ncbi:hypothetical protein JJV70_19845 [Streptomyces sp. JJ66]|uniref:DUF6003 family protein n=1 Tax=Streptomyces sp. JJ66 TaxID=2803843 RepID=UPI001C58CEFD|nr:DUF6003 family protein [Streptomyces sp. JJ66]MBW1604316.1 hypothetical protein [Streptomyces sp. JJ66]